MKNIILSFVSLAIAFTITACDPQDQVAIKVQEKTIAGTWTVESIETVQTDSMGKVLLKTTFSQQGTAEFKVAPNDGSNSSPFAPVLFENMLTTNNNPLVNYFKSTNAGNGTTKGGWSVYWEADPYAKRIMFWGIQAGGSKHKTVNMTRDGNKMTLTYIDVLIPQNPMTSDRIFYTYTLTK